MKMNKKICYYSEGKVCKNCLKGIVTMPKIKTKINRKIVRSHIAI